MHFRRGLLLWIGSVVLFSGLGGVEAQESAVPPEVPCGVVDGIGYPIDSLRETTIDEGFDDFALYRARFGANHAGIDVGFDQQGMIVHAVARGRVTLADVNEWGTEKGVVILEHIFPNGERYYSLYGHMEETNEVRFPTVGACLEQGDPVGAVGWPSLSAPHLHFEIRDFPAAEGGTGYAQENPLAVGWFHPLDFTHLWQIRLTPAFQAYAAFLQVPTLPPVFLDGGGLVSASGDLVEGVLPPREVVWRVATDGRVTGLRALPGDRVVAYSTSGQVVVLTSGRYSGLWTFPGVEERALQVVGETVVLVAADGGLSAFDPLGQVVWTLPAPAVLNGAAVRVIEFAATETTLALAVAPLEGAGAAVVRLVDGQAGRVFYEGTVATQPVLAAAPNGGWMLLADGRLVHVLGSDGAVAGPWEVGVAPGRTARFVADAASRSYLYLGDAEQTLLSWDANGGLRWRVRYPASGDSLLPPLLSVDLGCVLYVLDMDGRLSLFSTATGELLNQVQLYPGGARNRRPAARVLDVLADGRLNVSPGFLTLLTLDTGMLAGEALSSCLLG